MAADAALKAVTGRGWEYFHQPVNTTMSPLDWPTCSYASDQGSDAQAALCFLIYCMRCAIMKIMDQSHRVSNDADQALKDAGLHALVGLGARGVGTNP